MDSEQRERIGWLVITGVCSFCVGVLVALGLAMSLSSPGEREQELKDQVAELRAALTETQKERDDAQQRVTEMGKTAGDVAANLKKLERSILDRGEKEKKHGLGVSRDVVMSRLEPLKFVRGESLDGTEHFKYEVSGGGIVLWGTSEELTTVTFIGSFEKVSSDASSKLLAAMLIAVVPSWSPAERSEWFSHAIPVAVDLQMFNDVDGIRIEYGAYILAGVRTDTVFLSAAPKD